LKAGSCLRRLADIVCLLARFSAGILEGRLYLNHLSKFRGPPQIKRMTLESAKGGRTGVLPPSRSPSNYEDFPRFPPPSWSWPPFPSPTLPALIPVRTFIPFHLLLLVFSKPRLFSAILVPTKKPFGTNQSLLTSALTLVKGALPSGTFYKSLLQQARLCTKTI
jgi:hypothetical protein